MRSHVFALTFTVLLILYKESWSLSIHVQRNVLTVPKDVLDFPSDSIVLMSWDVLVGSGVETVG